MQSATNSPARRFGAVVPALFACALAMAPALAARDGEPASQRQGPPPRHDHPQDHPLIGFEFRSVNGFGNNPGQPLWGMAGTALVRDTTVDYGDGVSTPAGAHRPGARAVSNAVCPQGPLASATSQGASDFVWQWGQFVDHDMDLTEGADPPEPFDIAVPLGDPFFDPNGTGVATIALNRSSHDGGAPRQQMNGITAYIDASNVYGSDDLRARALRGPGGTLATSSSGLLPYNEIGLPNAPSDSPVYFLAGDIRANEQVGLTAMHTVFVREHNRLVRLLAAMGLDPDDRYQMARMIVGAEMQVITYREFLPALLGPDALPPYRGYDPRRNPGIENLFSSAAYRFGHSMLSPQLRRLDADGQTIAAGDLALRDAFFNPSATVDHGIEPVLRGLASQRAQTVDTQVVDDVRNFLFGPPGAGGFDLASLNIQRGRDHGLPSYNQARADYGLAPVASFAEVSRDPRVVERLASIYASVDDIDAWVGGLAEDHRPGALVGELVGTVLADQFARLRDGDRFWYQISLPAELVRYVESLTLADIIRMNTTIGDELPDNVFFVAASRP